MVAYSMCKIQCFGLVRDQGHLRCKFPDDNFPGFGAYGTCHFDFELVNSKFRIFHGDRISCRSYSYGHFLSHFL